MSKNSYYLGIDTSAYTTSIAVIDRNNKIIYDLRKMLEVAEGKLGLRQQEAIFQHMINLPLLLKKIDRDIMNNIEAIGVATRPRNLQGSYMPVFLQGHALAEVMSHILGVDLIEFSHQEGHIAAEYKYLEKLYTSDIVSFHLSGGTTEFLLVKNNLKKMDIELLGASLDISFGKLVDRLGVYLGLGFPAGKDLDEIALGGKILDLGLSSSIKDKYYINISGYENRFKGLIDSGKYKNEDLVRTMFNMIAKTIYEVIININEKYQDLEYLITGGVSANSHIRADLEELLKDSSMEVYFQNKKYSTDNAVGIANLTLSQLKAGGV